jgi:hypothetical protein
MRHFLYQHLPAGGLGHRDPVRPYPTGGLGFAYRIFRPASDLFMRGITNVRYKDIKSVVEGDAQ